ATASPFAASAAFAAAPEVATASKTDSTPYQAYLDAVCPDGSNFCKFVSEVVADGSRLDIRRVACQGWHIGATPPSFIVIGELRTSANAFVDRIDFLEAKSAPANGGSVWAISDRTQMFIPAGHKLQISLNSGSTTVGSYGCTISGYMTTVR